MLVSAGCLAQLHTVVDTQVTPSNIKQQLVLPHSKGELPTVMMLLFKISSDHPHSPIEISSAHSKYTVPIQHTFTPCIDLVYVKISVSSKHSVEHIFLLKQPA